MECVCRSDPLFDKNEPPDQVHYEDGGRGDCKFHGNVEWYLVPSYTQLGSNRYTHPPVANDPGPKV